MIVNAWKIAMLWAKGMLVSDETTGGEADAVELSGYDTASLT